VRDGWTDGWIYAKTVRYMWLGPLDIGTLKGEVKRRRRKGEEEGEEEEGKEEEDDEEEEEEEE
jgi:hypothetical protein